MNSTVQVSVTEVASASRRTDDGRFWGYPKGAGAVKTTLALSVVDETAGARVLQTSSAPSGSLCPSLLHDIIRVVPERHWNWQEQPSRFLQACRGGLATDVPSLPWLFLPAFVCFRCPGFWTSLTVVASLTSATRVANAWLTVRSRSFLRTASVPGSTPQ